MVLVTIVLVAVALGACTDVDVYVTSEGPRTTAHTPPKFFDTVSAWGIEMKLSGPAHYSYESTTIFAGEGMEAFVMIAHFRNTGSIDFRYNLSCWEGRDQDNRLYPASVSFRELGFTEGTIPPGGTAGGYVGFVLPKGRTLASVRFTPIDIDLSPKYVVWER